MQKGVFDIPIQYTIVCQSVVVFEDLALALLRDSCGAFFSLPSVYAGTQLRSSSRHNLSNSFIVFLIRFIQVKHFLADLQHVWMEHFRFPQSLL